MMKKTLILLFLLSSLAQASQSIDDIKSFLHQKVMASATERYPNFDVEIVIGNIDSRIKLAECLPDSLSIYNPYQRPLAKTGAVAVRCQAPHTWTIYVPVTVNRFTDVIVAQHAIGKGQSLTTDSLRLQRENVANLKGHYFTSIKKLENLNSRHFIRAGQVITSSLVVPQTLIKRGDEVTLRAHNGGIVVEMKGEALQNGIKGQNIAIKNLKSNKIIEGHVVNKGLIEIRL